MMVRRQSHPVYWPEHVRDREADVWVMFSLFVSVSLKLFVGGGRVGRPLGKLMCMQLCVRVPTYVCVRAPALASLLPSLQPPHSDSPVTEGLTTSHALPINSPAPLASLYL